MPEFLVTLLAFVVLLGILVFIHELGHFVMAKKVGIKVERFSLGFPPNIFTHKRGETEYCIGAIPLGGYVKMAGESPDEPATGRSYEFSSKKIWERTLVIIAGPLMNYLLAIPVLAFVLFYYGQPYYSETDAIVGNVSQESPADSIGLQADDVILTVNGQPAKGFEGLIELVHPRGGQPTEISWLRGADTLNATVTPKLEEIKTQDGIDTVGLLGISVKRLYRDAYSNPIAALGEGFNETNRAVVAIFSFLGDLITRNADLNTVGGPIYIAQEASRAAQRGMYDFLLLLSILSINLAILNVLPIPVLDGGHLVFLAIEKIKGSPLTTRARMHAQQIGMLFLMVFILIVSWNDIVRWINM